MTKIISKPSKAQQIILNELRRGRIIYEDKHDQWGHRLSYWTAAIYDEYPHCYELPRRCNKQVVWALLSLGLIETKILWPEHSNPKEVYVLREG